MIQSKNDVQDFCHLVAAMEVLRIKVRALTRLRELRKLSCKLSRFSTLINSHATLVLV